jgi:hypothetical protein
MFNSNLSACSLSELKAIAAKLDCTLNGDKRAKQSWIDAIELAHRIETLVDPEDETETEWEIRTSEFVGLSEVLDEIINGENVDEIDLWCDPEIERATQASKKGAIAVIGSILCAIIFVFCAACTIAHTIVKYTAIILQMFIGGYNPDYDFWYQSQQLAQQRTCQLLPIQQA